VRPSWNPGGALVEGALGQGRDEAARLANSRGSANGKRDKDFSGAF